MPNTSEPFRTEEADHLLPKLPADLAARISQNPSGALLIGDGPRWAVALIEPEGPATEPGTPALRVISGGAPDAALTSLVQAALEQIDGGRLSRVIALCDPMDRGPQRALEACGFRPGSRHPYFERSGGLVEYVTGYADATGAVLELVRSHG